MTMISNSGMDQSRCHWIMRLCGETADSCLCAFFGIDPSLSECFVKMFTLFILVVKIALTAVNVLRKIHTFSQHLSET